MNRPSLKRLSRLSISVAKTSYSKVCENSFMAAMFFTGILLVSALTAAIYRTVDRDKSKLFSFWDPEEVHIEGRAQCCLNHQCKYIPYLAILLVDRGMIFADVELNETLTDEDGYFKLSGHTKQLFILDPYLKVYHRCQDAFEASPLQHYIKINFYKIPEHYIYWGSKKTNKTTYTLFPLTLNIDTKETRYLKYLPQSDYKHTYFSCEFYRVALNWYHKYQYFDNTIHHSREIFCGEP